MSRNVTRSSRLSYYRTAVPYSSLASITDALKHGPVKSDNLTEPAASLLRHLHENASPGRVPASSIFYSVRPGENDAPFVLDVLTVEHKGRFVYYLNAMVTHRDARGGFSTGRATGWDMERRIVASSDVCLVDAEGTAVHCATNMSRRTNAPSYAFPHVLAATAMPVGTSRSLFITGDHESSTHDTSGFVPDGFTRVPWSGKQWRNTVAIPGRDLHDDMIDDVSFSLCSHARVTGADERVVIVSEFR